jgi:pimeloyl-ACP methyl ester carboxylesterase
LSRDVLQAAHIVTPALPLSGRSFAHLDDVAGDVVSLIDQQVQQRADAGWPEFEEIILVGHSTGSMISRKAYVIACGETSEAPFTHIDRFHPRELLPERPWVSRVTRIIQLAGMNGGWSISHHMGIRRLLELSAGRIIADLAHSATGRRLVIDHIRRGAPFLTGLRLQWLAMQKQLREKDRSPALVVQLLGTVDDLVAPDDNLDLVTGSAFLYLDVPRTGHVNVVEMNDPDAGEARRKALVLALTGTETAISKESVVPADVGGLGREHPDVTDVVFVIHGIRDTGFWTHKIARRVQAAGRRHEGERREFATETSTYGYFPMLSFLLPSRRREKVAWLADRYVRARRRIRTPRDSLILATATVRTCWRRRSRRILHVDSTVWCSPAVSCGQITTGCAPGIAGRSRPS